MLRGITRGRDGRPPGPCAHRYSVVPRLGLWKSQRNKIRSRPATIWRRQAIGAVPVAGCCVPNWSIIREGTLAIAFPWFLAGRMMDVQYLNRIRRDAIEHFVGIANERYHAHALTLGHLGSAFRPRANPCYRRMQSLFEWRIGRRVVGGDVGEDFIKIAQRVVSIDDLHARRCFAKTAATCLSVANRPSRAALS